MVTYGGMSRAATPVTTSSLIFDDIRYFGFWISRWYTRLHYERLKTAAGRQGVAPADSLLMKQREMMQHIYQMIGSGTLRCRPVEWVSVGPSTDISTLFTQESSKKILSFE